MLIYVMLMLTILGFGYIYKPNNTEKNKKTYMIIMGILLIIISGFRSVNVGADTWQFCADFNSIRFINWKNLFNSTRYEPGFVLICKILSQLVDNYQILIFFTSLVINIVICKFIYDESKDCILSLYLYVSLNYFATNMNIMRQAIAMAIIILAYKKFLNKEKKVLYIISVLIAYQFHTSALCGMLLLVIPNTKYDMKKYILTVISSIIMVLIANKLFVIFTGILGKYSGYINSEFYEPNYFAAVIKMLILFVILTVSYIYYRNIDNNKYMYISSFALIFGASAIKITLLGRISNYFSIFNIILLPNILKEIRDKKEIYLIYFLVYFLCFLYWIIVAIYRPEWHGVVPYEFFIN